MRTQVRDTTLRAVLVVGGIACLAAGITGFLFSLLGGG
jgi:hypothetical protein